MSKTEKTNSLFNDIIKPVVVLLAICIVIPLSLSFTNKITVNRIENLQKENQNFAMSELIEADSFKEEDYKKGDKSFSYYVAENGGEIKGYIFITSAKGYGGEVSVMTAVNSDSTIKAVKVLDVSGETPGLGQNAAKESFYAQYSEKASDVKLVKNGANGENNEVNAVTGATITSTAVTKAVNEAMDNYACISVDTEVTASEE